MSAVQEQYVVDPKGKKLSVILSLKRYRQLMEDLHDLAVVAERRNELPARQAARYQNPSEKLIAASREVSDPVWKNEAPISLEEMKRRLKKDDVL